MIGYRKRGLSQARRESTHLGSDDRLAPIPAFSRRTVEPLVGKRDGSAPHENDAPALGLFVRSRRLGALLGTAVLALASLGPTGTLAQTATFMPRVDHHLHLSSPETAAALSPRPLPALASIPQDITDVLAQRERLPLDAQAVAPDLYTSDAIIRARRSAGWVGGDNLARTYTDYTSGFRLLPAAIQVGTEQAVVAGYFARGSRYNATFQIALRREGQRWKIAAENIVPVPPVMEPPVSTAATLADGLDKAGISRGVVHSVAYLFAQEDFRSPGSDERNAVAHENDWTSEQVSLLPARLIGFCGIDPLKPYAVAEIERCGSLPGMVGVKLHFTASGVSLRNPDHLARVQAVFAAADRLGMPVAVHMEEASDYGEAQARIFVEQVLPRAPRIVVQVMHMAGSGPGYQRDAAFAVLAEARANQDPRARLLYVDIASNVTATSSQDEMDLVARRLRLFGIDHILFGSDWLPGVANDEPKVARTNFARLPLTSDEFAVIASNVAPYLK